MQWLSLVISFLIPAALCGQTMRIQEVHVEGNKRLKATAVVAASGLQVNTWVTRADLDKAAQRLFDTGLFTGMNYRYTPLGKDAAAGQSVTIMVTEEAARATVVLDTPGMDPEQMWAQLLGDSSLMDRVIPASAAATAYYLHQIEAVLAKAGRPAKLTTEDEADLATHASLVIVQPVDKPAIADITFEGNGSVPAQVIRERILKVTVGNSFSQREFRLILDSNIRPLYEEKGLLSVAFSAIRTTSVGDGKISVTTTIDEGRVWQLGKVALEGEDLPVDKMLAAGKFTSGRVANWKEFLVGLDNMSAVLKHDGYIGASSKPDRTFQPETGVVDITIKVDKGKQYRFASIEITGLGDAERIKALALWQLQAGQPMDGPCVNEYLKSVFKTVRPSKTSVSSGMKIRPGSDQVDVTVAFK
jgi:outer membrane protein assembly factor BamA